MNNSFDAARVRVLVSDIDGTLIPEAAPQVDPEYFELIIALRKAGYRVILASGRQKESIEMLFHPILEHVDIVSSGGLCITTDAGTEMLNSIPRDWVEEIERDIEALEGVEAMISSSDITFAQNPDGEMCCFLRDAYGVRLSYLDGVGQLPDIAIGKISLYAGTKISERASQFTTKWQDRLNITQAGEFWIDCVMPEISKAHAIQKLLDSYGLSKEQLFASGDQMNDMAMLRLAGQSLAVSNAHPELKEIATFSADNSDFKAVARVWRSLL